jgi:ParB/RepB/Spo0J family partition protein
MKMSEGQVSVRAVAPKETKLIEISKIEVVFRARQDKGDITALADSIRTNGLIHNIVVKETTEPGKYALLAGERRLLACKELGKTQIRCNIYPADLSQLEKDLIELCENTDRKDMTIQEDVDLKKRIHNTMQKLHGVSKAGSSSGHGMRDTARMLGVSEATVSRDIQLAEAMEAIPELAECKDKAEAMKVMKKLVKEHKRGQVAKAINAKKATTPEELAKKALIDSYIVGDFFKESSKIPSDSIDLVEVDPPFGIDLHSIKKNAEYYIKDYSEWDKSEYKKKIEAVAAECYRIMNPNSWIVWWFAWEPWFEGVYQTLVGAGFEGLRIPGVWVKPGAGQASNPDKYLASNVEPFFYMRKGSPSIEYQGRSNSFHFKPVPPDKKIHPTEKPVEMMSEIYETFVPQGSRICVPFLGSGNGILAATNNGCTAFGYDLSQEYKNGYMVRVDEGDGKFYGDRRRL